MTFQFEKYDFIVYTNSVMQTVVHDIKTILGSTDHLETDSYLQSGLWA